MSTTISIILRLLMISLLTWGRGTSQTTNEEVNPPPSGLTPLTRAIRMEEFEKAREHITPELVNKMDQGQYHPLTYAAYTGNNDLIEALLKAGADPNAIEHNGKTALYVAANLANTEGLKLLHQHGAKRPPKTALSPAVAAVYSSSLDSLKTLLELYPDIDLNRGWKSASQSDSFRLGCAINYAAYYGYSDIALYLLSRNAAVTGRNYFGENALDHAVANNRCSVELVEALLARGLNPVRIYHSNRDNSPNTPLAAAVVGGNLAKVKAMANGLDPEKDYISIRKASQVAAACNKTEIMTYLLGLLGEKLLGPKDYLKTFNSRYPEEDLKNFPLYAGSQNATQLRSGELSQIMPRAIRRTSASPATGSVAIISSPSLGNYALLLTTALSKQDGITVLERDSIGELLSEKSLKSFQSGDSTALHKNLDLISASHIVIFSDKSVNDKSFIQVSIIDTGSGMVSGRFAIPPKDLANDAEIEQLASLVLSSMTSSLDGNAAISITAIKPGIPSPDTHALANLINTILPFHAANTRGCVSLARDQLQHLETEKAIGINGSYWTAAWVIDGGIKTAPGDIHTITLRATNPGNGKSFQAEHHVDSHDAPDSILRCWKELVRQLNIEAPDLERHETTKEPEVLAKHAEWLLASAYPGEAIELLRACRALGDHSTTTKQLTLRALLATLPQSRSSEENSRIRPRNKNLIQVFQATESIHEFQLLCDAAIEYAETVHKNSRPQGHLQGNISLALYELFYFRTMMDNAIIYQDHGSELELLDQGIAKLTDLYLSIASQSVGCRHCEQTTVHNLFYYDWDYYALHQPELNERIARQIWSGDFHSFPNYTAAELLERKVYWSHRLEGYKPSKVWSDMTRKLLQNTNTKHLFQLHITALNLANGGVEKRKQALNVIRFLNSTHRHCEDIRQANQMLGIEIDNLLGIEISYYWSYSAVSRKGDPPRGGVSGCLWQPQDEARSTKEFIRLQGFYEWLDDFSRMSESSLRRLLKGKLGQVAETDPELTPSSEDWKCLRKMWGSHGKETSEVASLFDKLTSSGVMSTPDSNFQLSAPILFPSISIFPRHGQVAFPFRSTVDKSEAWIPVFYKEPRTLWQHSKTYRHAIQVVSLEDGSIQTAIMPENSPKKYVSGVNHENILPVILGNDKAYYHIDIERLFCIDRKTKRVSEVRLPLRYIQHLSMSSDGQTLYASLSSGRDKGAVTSVVSIKGDQIVETLVSSQRRPEESPMDNPEIRIKSIVSETGNTEMIGRIHNPGREQRELWCGASYDLEKKWTQLSKRELERARNLLYKKIFLNPISTLGRNIGDEMYFPTRGEHAEITFSGEGEISAISRRSVTSDNMVTAYQARLPVGSKPVECNTFRIPNYMIRLDDRKDDGKTEEIFDPPYSYKGWWYSPNDLIKKRLFDVRIIGRWKRNYLVMLYYNDPFCREEGFPAFWTVPFEEIDQQISSVLSEYARPIHFDAQPLGSLGKVTTGHATIEIAKGLAEIVKTRATAARSLWNSNPACASEQSRLRKALHFYGNDGQIIVTPIKAREITTLIVRAELYNRKHGAMLGISADVDGHWKKVCETKRLRLVEADLPPGTKRIAITCNSTSKDHGIVIEDLLLK